MSYELPPIVGGCMVKGTEDEADMGLREEFARMRAEIEWLRAELAASERLREHANRELAKDSTLVERLRAALTFYAKLKGHPVELLADNGGVALKALEGK